MQWAVVLFWVSAGAIGAGYIAYPLVLLALSRLFPQKPEPVLDEAQLPPVAVIIPVHNAGAAIEAKVHNTFASHYPPQLLSVWVGLDGCTDDTHQRIAALQKRYAALQVMALAQRSGKAQTLNTIVAQTQAPVLVLTDVSAMLEADAVRQLVNHFADAHTGVVSTTLRTTGNSKTEGLYTAAEARLKQLETHVLGNAMGVFGPCYAVRRAAYNAPPANTLADDFYIAMAAAQNGFRVVQSAAAVTQAAAMPQTEVMRRVRIGAGNWQNLARFAGVLWQDNYRLSVAFFFHKVLRWLTPFFLLAAFAASGFLVDTQVPFAGIYTAAWVGQQLGLLLALLAWWQVKWLPVNPIGHFYLLNGALLLGFIRWLRGVNSGVWQPTPR
jgi:cellulose synthase/poly-beta-1,6-N-acetylglucosamine synthase-like glycosyltransferase